MDVLEMFNICPEATSYLSRIFKSRHHSTELALQKKGLSSAKKRWLNLWSFLKVGTPVIVPLDSACWRRELRASTQNKKK
jgi:hypothetical protein